MTDPAAPSGRMLAEVVRDIPDRLVARPVTPADVGALTALMRASDIAGCGHSTTNVDEVRDELDDPDCGWERGCATVWRGTDLVGALLVFDGLAGDRGWTMDIYSAVGDPQAHEIQGALIDSALDEGRARWSTLLAAPASAAQGLPEPIAKSGCYAKDAITRADLEVRRFAEVRRFWRMRITHETPAPPGGEGDGEPPTLSWAIPGVAGCSIRPFDGSDADLHAFHRTGQAAFREHFDFTPLEYGAWLERIRGATEDPAQWLIAECDGAAVAFARGSNRYTSEGSGYVVSIGVLRDHRGKGLARALLLARFADDRARGLGSTLLHVDASNETGATRLYESVGMVADSETVWFHRPLFD